MTDGEFGVGGGWYLRDSGWIGAGTGPVLRGLSRGWMARVTADGEYTDADACGGGRPWGGEEEWQRLHCWPTSVVAVSQEAFWQLGACGCSL